MGMDDWMAGVRLGRVALGTTTEGMPPSTVACILGVIAEVGIFVVTIV
jgi:hypothetical protein